MIKNTQKITNTHLLTYPGEWFPITRDGEVENIDEFISLKMKQYGLRTRGPVIRAIRSTGYALV